MNIKHLFCAAALSLTCATQAMAQADTLWLRYDDRFKANDSWPLTDADSIVMKNNVMMIVNKEGVFPKRHLVTYTYDGTGRYQFSNPGRWLYHPSAWASNDYTNPNSRWSFHNSRESEHFIVFWDKQFGDDPTKSAQYAFNPQAMLNIGEKCWDVYAGKLGFIKEGQSTTDQYKIHMYVFYQSDWKAEGSGYDYKTGSFSVCPWASTSRDGQTVAHEIGHTFQYLVKCDLGEPHGFDYGYGDNASGLNGWWEGCANWQAYVVYPNLKFSQDFYDAYKGQYHLGLMNETFRYQNMFIQDWWCQLHGADFIGRMWREACRPEDPIEAYMRMNEMTIQQFNDETYEGFARMATWDIDGIRTAGRSKIGDYSAKLHEAPEKDGWIEVDSAYCPENYGYNMIPLKLPAGAATVSAQFRGVAGEAQGFRRINVDKAGWRYGFVAYNSATDQRSYGEMGKAKEGTVSFDVPEGTTHLWLCVMGAPTSYWRHPWDDNTANDEQWPYRVRFTGTDATEIMRDYAEYPDNYARRDTTIVINTTLARSTTDFSSVRVQYDMDAVSRALGLSTAQMKGVKVGKGHTVRFVGVSANGNLTENTTTTTSSETCYGHWFTTTANVCGYGGDAAVFAEFYPEKYGCYIGQKPGKLVSGKTYTTRQAIVYTHIDGKEYRATMEVNVKIK